MGENNLQMIINKASFYFQKCFVNNNGELIVEPKNNIYFRIDDISTKKEFETKVIAYLSRSCTKGLSAYWQRYMLQNTNLLLDKNFSKEDMELIYTYLGGNHTSKRIIEFIEKDMSIEWLKEEVK